MKWVKLLGESNTIPSDKKSIDDSFNKDVSDEKFIPTEEFARTVYNKVNIEFFFNYLPSDVEFKIKNTIRGGEFGVAIGNKYTVRGKSFISDFKLILNSSVTMSIHDWIGVVIHEMIHILDYDEHPDHYMNKEYNPHGEWFLEQGKRFEKFGFHGRPPVFYQYITNQIWLPKNNQDFEKEQRQCVEVLEETWS